MNWDEIKTKLEQILDIQFKWEVLHKNEWFIDGNIIEENNQIYFYLYSEGNHHYTFSVNQTSLTPSEKSLIEMAIDTCRSNQVQTELTSEEQKPYTLRDWIMNQLQYGSDHEKLPESLLQTPQLLKNNIPILIQTHVSDQNIGTDEELFSLLQSFYDSHIVFVPLSNKEYLLLCSLDLIEEEIEEQGKDIEQEMEDSLQVFSSSLYEMLLSEWVGKCHIAIHYPIVPSESVLLIIKQLREIMELGQNYCQNEYIYSPWNLYLEALLDILPDEARRHFIERVFKQVDFVLDVEMKTTLEQFFNTGCNVSETAKKLYIHRNTLIYRLDKFKQETGLDVRVFNQAVLVKVSLLLYKVTKRH
ncbi:PucR family transcriptional regulator [Chengkuizengella sediminis]|uniref:PucR family transcriptional regulator n=1 Tax=Chengkuizengella sediminis TaxID=1885917 RepID=UPI0013899A82|nr:helix-turn-helix domain-containing protein [Chengkuizengella sediminis]NDI36585.1 PucR family transcriptional regulator [Chengkuizengella sediminis]